MDKPKPNKLAQFYSGQIQPNGALSLRRSVQFWSGVDTSSIKVAAETALLGFIGFPSAVDFEFHSKIAKKRSVYIANELKRCMQPLCLKSSSDCFGRILL
jgi:hypothetical protein